MGRAGGKWKYWFYLVVAASFSAAYPLLESWVRDRVGRTFDGRYYWLTWAFLAGYALLMGLDGWVCRRLGLTGREAFLPRAVAAAGACVLLGIGIWQMWGLRCQYLLVFICFLLTKAVAERKVQS